MGLNRIKDSRTSVSLKMTGIYCSLFPQAKLAEELGDEFVWCGVTSNFTEDFPGPGHIDLEKVNRPSHLQALVDGLQAF